MDAAGSDLLRAAKSGDAEAVQRWLALGVPADEPHAYGLIHGTTALGVAAISGHAHIVRLLLAAGAQPTLPNPARRLPIHWAAAGGSCDALELLLLAAPQTAAATDYLGWTPLLQLCKASDNPGAVRLLLAAAPQASTMAASDGSLPIHAAAATSRDGAALRLLLAAAPHLATAARRNGDTPLHCAAAYHNAAAAKLLLAVAPQAASVRNALGDTPLRYTVTLDTATWSPPLGDVHTEIAHALMDAMPPAEFLRAVPASFEGSRPALQLYQRIASRHRLSAAHWQLVPSPCPGLGTVLPAVLARSQAEAALLVARLPAADRARLRTFALCLNRLQRQLGVALPGAVAGRILALFDSA